MQQSQVRRLSSSEDVLSSSMFAAAVGESRLSPAELEVAKIQKTNVRPSGPDLGCTRDQPISGSASTKEWLEGTLVQETVDRDDILGRHPLHALGIVPR